VEKKFKSCPKCQRRFSEESGLSFCPTEGAKLSEASTLLNSTIASKYVLQEELGSGSWGTVYAARNTEVGNKVAVKIMSFELSENERHVEAFKQESLALTRLDHPGLALVGDRGLNPMPFIVIEWVPGKLLSELIAEKKKIPAGIVQVMARKLFEALDYAHAFTLTHGNLKPQNIKINNFEQPEKLELKVLDFGVARLMDQKAILDASGEPFGSLPYMSPERFTAVLKVGPKSDVYAAGLILFECLTGSPPFTAESFVTWKAAHAHVHAAFTDGDGVAGHKALTALILRCLSKNPDDRPTSREALAELNKIRLTKTGVEAGKPVSELMKPLLKFAGLALVAALIIGAGAYFLMKSGLKIEAPQKVQTVDESGENEVISAMAAGQTLQKVETESAQLKLKKRMTVDLRILKPASPQAVVVVLSGAGKELTPIFKRWAERGFLVAIASVDPKQSSAAASETIVRAAMKKLPKISTAADAPPPRFALVSLRLDLDQTMALAIALSKNSDHSLPELGGVIVVNPSAEAPSAKSKLDPNLGRFSMLYILDADLDKTTRPFVTERCQDTYLLRSSRFGKQIMFTSVLTCFSADEEDKKQQALESVTRGFLHAVLNRDKTKESYLFSQKAALALQLVGDLRCK
jgi:hypothetical protein